MLSVFSSENSKWQLLYLSSLYVIGIFFGRQQAAASLFKQLVCYRYFLWTTTGSFLYLNNLRIYSLFTSALTSISENLAKKSVTTLHLQKSVISYPHFDTLCLPSTLSCELTVLRSIICCGLCKMLYLLGLEVVFPRPYSLSRVCLLKSIVRFPSSVHLMSLCFVGVRFLQHCLVSYNILLCEFKHYIHTTA